MGNSNRDSDCAVRTMSHIVVPGRPKPKQRPRMTRRGRVYTPEETLQYEDLVRTAYKAQDGELYDGPVRISVRLTNEATHISVQPTYLAKSPLRGDIDNYLKSIMDGLQGAAFNNDRQVVALYAVKL